MDLDGGDSDHRHCLLVLTEDSVGDCAEGRSRGVTWAAPVAVGWRRISKSRSASLNIPSGLRKTCKKLHSLPLEHLPLRNKPKRVRKDKKIDRRKNNENHSIRASSRLNGPLTTDGCLPRCDVNETTGQLPPVIPSTLQLHKRSNGVLLTAILDVDIASQVWLVVTANLQLNDSSGWS